MKLKTLAIGAILAASAASALAYTRYFTTVHYFSDATYSVIVGVKETNCQNTVTVDGAVTSYSRVVERFSCNGPIP